MKSDIAFWAIMIISQVWGASGHAWISGFWLVFALVVRIAERTQRLAA
jgi:hypothetical protein